MDVESDHEVILGDTDKILDDIVIKDEYLVEENPQDVNIPKQFTIIYSEAESEEDEINIAVRALIFKQREGGSCKVTVKCYVCGEKFHSPSILRAHLMKHRSTQKIEPKTRQQKQKIACKFCPGLELEKGAHNVHMQIYHSCLVCGMDDLESKMERENHMQLNHPQPAVQSKITNIKCKICNTFFNRKCDLKKHTKRTHSKSFFCLQCNMKFQSEEKLVKHMGSHKEKGKKKKRKKVKQRFPCDECDSVFFDIEEYINHVRVHVQERRPGTRQILKCEHCDETFINDRQYKKHVQFHADSEKITEDDALFVCDYCNSRFLSEKTYKSHIQTHKKSLECPYCLKAFEQLIDKEFHIGSNHPGLPKSIPSISDFPTKCSICKRTFNTIEDMKKHSNKHVNSTENTSIGVTTYSTEDPWECNICKIIFPSIAKKKKHLALIHEDTADSGSKRKRNRKKNNQLKNTIIEEKNKQNHLQCRICSEFFNSVSELLEHFKTHKDAGPSSTSEKIEASQVKQNIQILPTVSQPQPTRIYIFPKARVSSSEDEDDILEIPPHMQDKFNGRTKLPLHYSSEILSAPSANEPDVSAVKNEIDSPPICETIEIEDDDDYELSKSPTCELPRSETVVEQTANVQEQPQAQQKPTVQKREIPPVVWRNSTLGTFVSSFENFVTNRQNGTVEEPVKCKRAKLTYQI